MGALSVLGWCESQLLSGDVHWPRGWCIGWGTGVQRRGNGQNHSLCVHCVMQESLCLSSCPGEERPRQRNVCGDRDSFELGLWSGQENTGNWLQLKVLLPGDCSRDGKIDK